MVEEFKVIPNYENFMISNFGRVYNSREQKFANQFSLGAGYMGTSLRNTDGHKIHYVHRLVATAFVPRENPRLEVDHINGSRNCNYANNLRWVTRSENLSNRRTMGKPIIQKNGEFIVRERYRCGRYKYVKCKTREEAEDEFIWKPFRRLFVV